ncbi:MAG: type II secretion system F family protein [Candidatus Acidiferrales bacterium]
MGEYICKVADTAGKVFQQVETAQSESEARQKLADRGLFVYSVRAQLGILSQLSRNGAERKVVRSGDFLIFNQQFNTLIKAGLPILRALDLLAERAATPRLRPVLLDVRDRVREGASLSEGFEKTGLFPMMYLTSIIAGEKSGNLSGVLDQYIAYQKLSTGFRNRLLTVLIYPAILITAVTLILSYLVTFVIPRFAQLYSELGTPLPELTKIVLAISLPLRSYLFVVLSVLAAAIIFIFLWIRTEQGKIMIDRMKPRLPLFGDVWLKARVAQFTRTLATLLAGGTPVVNGLDTVANSIGSRLFATSIHEAAAKVRDGGALAASLAGTKLMPDLALEMIEVGEASGALTPMLNSVAEFYEEEVNTRLTRLLAWIEPAILVVMAIVVAFILIALYLPIFSLNAGTAAG